MLSLYTLAISIGSIFLLAFLAFSNPWATNKTGNRWLGLFLVCFGLMLSSVFIEQVASARAYTLFIVFSEVARFVIAPALYLCIAYYTSPQRHARRGDLLHFIPAALFVINILPLLIINTSAPLLLNQFVMQSAAEPYVRAFMSAVIKIQILLYWVASYRKLTRHSNNLHLFLSDTHARDLRWLQHLLLGILALLLLWFNKSFFNIAWLDAITPIATIIAIAYISFFALHQQEVYPLTDQERAVAETVIAEHEHPTTQPERLTADALDQHKKTLIDLMLVQKLYRQPALGLADLADKLNLSSHELSYLLNHGLGLTFFDFVNHYRIEEAKRLLLSEAHRHLSVVGIAFESGFNSKTAFNTTFKRLTGITPTQYRKEHGFNGFTPAP